MLWIGGLLLAACSTGGMDGDIMDGFPEMPYQDSSHESLLGQGVYDMVWVVDQQVVDTATFSTVENPEFTIISHFPIDYFFDVVGRHVEKEDIAYVSWESYWKMVLYQVGYSDSNSYLSNATWAPRVDFDVKGVTYSLLVYLSDERQPSTWYTSLVYDIEHDAWSGSAPVYRFQLTDINTNECWSYEYPTPLNLYFQTTGRRR